MFFHCPSDTEIQKRWRNSSDSTEHLHFSINLSHLSVPIKQKNISPAFSPLHHYLPQVSCHLNVVPRVVIELAIDWLHNGLEGPRPQVNDQGDCTIFQGQVDIISWLAGMQDEPVALPGLEGESDLIAAALNGVLWQVVAKVFGTTESGHVLISCWKKEKRNYSAVSQKEIQDHHEISEWSHSTASVLYNCASWHTNDCTDPLVAGPSRELTAGTSVPNISVLCFQFHCSAVTIGTVQKYAVEPRKKYI